MNTNDDRIRRTLEGPVAKVMFDRRRLEKQRNQLVRQLGAVARRVAKLDAALRRYHLDLLDALRETKPQRFSQWPRTSRKIEEEKFRKFVKQFLCRKRRRQMTSGEIYQAARESKVWFSGCEHALGRLRESGEIMSEKQPGFYLHWTP